MVITRSAVRELWSILERTEIGEKHHGYHVVPPSLSREASSKTVFYEDERLDYILGKVEVSGKSVLDIGCNVGYFLFELLNRGATRVTGYEGKKICTDFIERAIELSGLEGRFSIHNKYFQFSECTEHYDLGILLNVLHHVGDDYGDSNLSLNAAKQKIIDQLISVSSTVDYLIFQMGFNWQGNVNNCFFDHGTKAEMIEFVTEGINEFWDVLSIGVAVGTKGNIRYEDVNDANIARDDSLGEFLNRPLFILRSRTSN